MLIAIKVCIALEYAGSGQKQPEKDTAVVDEQQEVDTNQDTDVVEGAVIKTILGS